MFTLSLYWGFMRVWKEEDTTTKQMFQEIFKLTEKISVRLAFLITTEDVAWPVTERSAKKSSLEHLMPLYTGMSSEQPGRNWNLLT